MFFSKVVSSIIILLILVVDLYSFEQTLSPNENISVGDKVVLNIKADDLNIDSLDKSKLKELNFGDFELLDIQPAQDGTVNFVLSVYKAGKVELLSVEIPYTYNDEKKFVKTKALPIEIKSVLNPQQPPADIQDIKGIIKFNHGILWYVFFILILIILGLKTHTRRNNTIYSS